MLRNFKKKWKMHLNSPIRAVNFIATLVLLVLVLMFFSQFLLYIESRTGFAFTDPLLKLFPPLDLTYLIFAMIYAMLLTAVISLISNPDELVVLIRSYILVLLFRAAAMYLLPLDPPMTTVLLQDPFIELFASGGQTLTKDLFFSGHTATSFLLFLTVNNKFLKILFLIFTVLIAVMVLLQHVHYTIDVIAAPFFAYGAYKFSYWIDDKLY